MTLKYLTKIKSKVFSLLNVFLTTTDSQPQEKRVRIQNLLNFSFQTFFIQ